MPEQEGSRCVWFPTPTSQTEQGPMRFRWCVAVSGLHVCSWDPRPGLTAEIPLCPIPLKDQTADSARGRVTPSPGVRPTEGHVPTGAAVAKRGSRPSD